jgi:glyoxalase/bleomycin resistance protein/dioxygenase superfamily protein
MDTATPGTLPLYLTEFRRLMTGWPPETASLPPPMAQFALHHVSVIVTDLARSLAFYQKLFGLTTIERPAFKVAGAPGSVAAT